MESKEARLGREWEGRRRILAIRLDNIGDVLMLDPAVRAIKRNLVGTSLTLLASHAGARASALLPELDGVMSHKVIWQDVGGTMLHDIGREYRLVEEIRQRNFDAAIIFTSFSQSPYPAAYVCYLAGVPLRVGQSKEFGGGTLNTWVRAPADSLHQVERNLSLLEELGFHVANRDLSVRIPAEAKASLDEKLAVRGIKPNDSFILLHPFTSCQARTYPIVRMAAVARGITADLQLPVVLCGHELDQWRFDASGPDKWGHMVSLVGQTTLAEYAAIVARAALVVGNNTSSMHLADALGTPCLVTFSGTDLESQWRPRKTRNLLLRKPTDCSPCYLFRCPFKLECLDFEPDEVVCAAKSLLS